MIAPAGDGTVLLPVTILMLTLSWIFFLLRLLVRHSIKPEALGVDDYIMAAGLLLYSITCALVIVCCFYGAGQKRAVLSAADIMQGTKLFFIAEFFYAACTAVIKASICATLIRIAAAKQGFVMVLWCVAGAAAAAAVIFIVAIANICHPITTLWGETTYGTCNNELNSSVSFFFSAVSIATDWTLALLPAALLWGLQMPWRVKASVGLILGLAAFASCATIVRLRYLTLYDDQSEFMYSTGQIGLWSVVEEGIGITAGSMPALRPLLSLSRFGGSGASGSGVSKQTTGQLFPPTIGGGRDGMDAVELENRERHKVRQQNKRHPHVRLGSRGGSAEDGDGEGKTGKGDSSDADSEKHILKEHASILKETRVVMTAEAATVRGEWERTRVVGWER